jgi:enediyne biosynthesis protein E5
MKTDANGRPAAASPRAGEQKPPARFAKIKPFLAPVLITLILVAGQYEYGILDKIPFFAAAISRIREWNSAVAWILTIVATGTGAAIATSILGELVLSLFATGRWPHLASCYITGISVGIILRAPILAPYIVCSLLSITSKYALRVKGRHLWNPSNLGVSVLLFLAPDTAAPLSQQWGNAIWVPLIILFFGALILYSLSRLHITLTYIAAFLVLSFVQIGITRGDWGVVMSVFQGEVVFREWVNQIALLTAPPYLLFMIFMITDPKTTTRGWRRQCAVAVLVAIVEALLRLNREIHAPYYALFIVAPVTNLAEIAWDALHPQKPKPVASPLARADDKSAMPPGAAVVADRAQSR